MKLFVAARSNFVDVGPLLILALLQLVKYFLFKATILKYLGWKCNVEVSCGSIKVKAIDSNTNDEIGRIIKVESGVGGVIDKVDEILGDDYALGEDRDTVFDEDDSKNNNNNETDESSSGSGIIGLAIIPEKLYGSKKIYFFE